MLSKIQKCLEEGEKRGERHKGLRRIHVKQEVVYNHLRKAAHNLSAMVDFKNMGYSDWSASAAFYALYHCLLALLLKQGYESRNQSCTFAFVEELIKTKKITLQLEDVNAIFDKDITEDLAHSEKILDIRETMQYSWQTSLNEQEFATLFEKTKSLFDKIRVEIEK